MTKRAFAVIPVREFGGTKLRLASVLSREQRASLTLALLNKVLVELSKSEVDFVAVVASSVSEAKSHLSGFSRLEVIQESQLHGGVNSAMKDGLKLFKSEGGDRLLLPSDLPLISSDAINRALEHLSSRDLVINASAKKDGTNLLAFRAQKIIELHYDDDSYSKHVSEARSGGLNFITVDWEEFSFDVDDPRDLRELKERLHAKDFAELLRDLKKS